MTVSDFRRAIGDLRINRETLISLGHSENNALRVSESFNTSVKSINERSSALDELINNTNWNRPFPGSFRFLDRTESIAPDVMAFAIQDGYYSALNELTGRIEWYEIENLDCLGNVAFSLEHYLNALLVCAQCRQQRWLKKVSAKDQNSNISFLNECVRLSGEPGARDHYAYILWI